MARPGDEGRIDRRPARQRIERICRTADDDRVWRADVLHQIRTVVPFDSYVWVSTDPETAVGASPLAQVPSLRDLPTLIRLKYLTTVNRWTALDPDRVRTLVEATRGVPSHSLLWRELLNGYGVRDVASAVLRDRHGCWGFLDLWRCATMFTSDEQEFLGGLLPILTDTVRRQAAATFTVPPPGTAPDGPAVLLLTDTLEAAARTRQADTRLRSLLPTPVGHTPVPAVALNVAAQLLAQEAGVDGHDPSARWHEGHGRWVQVRAARLEAASDTGPTLAVTIEPAAPARRAEIYGRTMGLTAREAQVVELLVAGADTRAVARGLGIGEQTVNDHLRAVFAKAGVNSRRQLIANAQGR